MARPPSLMSSKVFSYIGVAACVFGIGWSCWQNHLLAVERGQANERLRLIGAEVQRLRSQAPQVVVLRPEPPGAISALSSPSMPGQAPIVELSPVPEAEVEEQYALWIKSLGEQLAMEPADPSWGEATQLLIVDVVRNNAVGSSVVNASCRRSLCRVVVAHDSPTAEKEFSRVVASHPPFASGALYDRGEQHGTDQTVLFVARNGIDFTPSGAVAR